MYPIFDVYLQTNMNLRVIQLQISSLIFICTRGADTCPVHLFFQYLLTVSTFISTALPQTNLCSDLSG